MLKIFKKRSAKGFTLIELLVVVVIIGILAAVALPNLIGQTDKARLTEATATMPGINTGQEAYFFENKAYATIGTMPTTIPASVTQTKAATLSNTELTTVTANTSGTEDSSFNSKLGVDITALASRWDFATASNGATTSPPAAGLWNAAATGKTTSTDTKGLGAYMLKGVNKTFTDSVK